MGIKKVGIKNTGLFIRECKTEGERERRESHQRVVTEERGGIKHLA